MRTYDRLIAVALLAAGLGLTSAIAFEGTGARDGAAPTVNAAPVPPGAVTAPALAPASPAMPSSPGGTIPGAMRAPDLKRGLTPGDRLTPAEAFRSGTQALQAGDIKTGLRALEYAAQNGHAIAQWKLGRMYADGDQVRRNNVQAFEYFHDMDDNQ